MSYFEELQQDWDTLGFGFDIAKRPTYDIAPIDTESYGQLHHLMINLSLNVESVHKSGDETLQNIESEGINTDLGRRLLVLCQLQQPCTSVDRHICGEAEPIIAGVLDPSRFTPPVLLTRDENLAGMMKMYADDYYYYALQDDDRSQTSEGFVYRMKNVATVDSIVHPDGRSMSNLNQYRHTDLNAIQRYIGGGRLSFFTTPVEARRKIRVPAYHRQKYDGSLNASHEELQEFASSIFEQSEPVTVSREIIRSA